MKDKSAVLLNLTGEQLAEDVSKHLHPLIREQVNYILDEQREDNHPPMTMDEACDYLGISRGTLSKLVGQGKIPFKSLNPENRKAKKLFLKKDLREWLQKNRTKTVDEIKKASYGK
tara:strand:+ start:89 stop:436 length:348 start_codon:yes stop_codon:yes gene_type:complete